MRITTEQDTIAAIATALSPSGIGIVRISGADAWDVAGKVFSPGAIGSRTETAKSLAGFESHTVHYGHIKDPADGRAIDEVMLLAMRAPRTYTREDTVEIDCHGGVLVTKRVLEAVLAAGARLADPGEFTRRAYMNGRIDLSQAEAVAGVIQAKNELSLRNSVRQLSGRMRSQIAELRTELLREIAQIEAALDDPEHLSLDGYSEVIARQTAEQRKILRRLIDTAEDGRMIREGIKTVIVGRPNAGKSSLWNALLGEDRAIVTEIAGTTRDTLTEEVRMRGITLLLMDTAGIRATEDTVERIGVARARQAAEQADLILYVVDGSAPLDENDRSILAVCAGKPMIVLVNKSDLAAVTTAKDVLRACAETAGTHGRADSGKADGCKEDGTPCSEADDRKKGEATGSEADGGRQDGTACSEVDDRKKDEATGSEEDGCKEDGTAGNSDAMTMEPIAVSAKTGEGLELLEERITQMFFAERIRTDDECVITSERHRQALLAAEDSLARVRESIDTGLSEDFYTIDLTAAYESLGTILGEEPDEDVINAIFAEFCLGK